MADDWDDWGDDDNKSAKGSDKSEGWDWPAAEGGASGGSALVAKQEQRQHDPSPDLEDVEERNAAVDEMTGKYFLELQKYLEDLADPSVREEINQVCTLLLTCCNRRRTPARKVHTRQFIPLARRSFSVSPTS